ncbi:hypothetical protein DQ04_07341030 [Trypanosoma grayi]|uniref:hypothetical protein n=1 Tax=Trypanosoma grayi TaxID=71804 RepID=UPI0004F41C3E|nr:hypothetical protein DQ04_07341030 [Trypanosoma grayi]KEG08373.1 hypothetical protein DQ04_07341030 [Trypanosoma grayi]
MDSTQVLLALLDVLQRMTRPESSNSSTLQGQAEAPPSVEDLFASSASPALSTPTNETVTSVNGNRNGNASPNSNGAVVSTTTTTTATTMDVEHEPSKVQFPASLRETASQFVKKKPFAEADVQAVCVHLRRLIDRSASSADSANIVYMGPELDKLTTLIRPLALTDVRVAVYMSSFISNIAALRDVRTQVSASLLWDLAMAIAQTYIAEPGALQLVLMAMANLAHLDELKLTHESCDALCRLIFPNYTEVKLIEAWITVLCNVTANHPKTAQVFVELGLVEVLERLVLYVGEDGKVAIRGMQCLSNLAVGFTNGHPAALET